MTSRSNTSFG